MGDRPARPVAERFWEKTQIQPDGCRLWTAVRGGHGYGRFRGPDGRTHLAHRFAYELTYEPIPAGLVVRHVCDVKACVEPTHLTLGTHSDNARDSVDRGILWQTRVTHCPKGHPYSGENLLIRMRNGREVRICRACQTERDEAHYAKVRSGLPSNTRPTPEQRFLSKTARNDSGCLLWTGTTNHGYGSLKVGVITVRAHRFAWELVHGPIPDEMVLLHVCDTPACVEVAHLRLGTLSANMLDASSKKRHGQARKTACPKGHPYEQYAETYKRVGGGDRRICLECMRLQKEQKRAAEKPTRPECMNKHPWDLERAVLREASGGGLVCPECGARQRRAWTNGDVSTCCTNGHPWTEETTRWIRRTDGRVQRRCVVCANEYKKKWRAERKAKGLPKS